MPEDRLFHKRLGHSRKVNLLTDIEEIAWYAYILAANDFGVMQFDPLPLQVAHRRLKNRSKKVVQRMLDRVRSVGLIEVFEHQGELYCVQLDWQDFQKIRYPLKTTLPRPPRELMARASVATLWLYTAWPGGRKKLQSWEPSEEFLAKVAARRDETLELFPGTFRENSGTVPETSGRSRASAPARGLVPVPDPVPVPGSVPPAPYPYPEEKPTGARAPESVGPVENLKNPSTRKALHDARSDGAQADRMAAALCDRAGSADSGADDRRRRMGGADQAEARRIGFRLGEAAASADGGDAGRAASAREAMGPAADPGSVSPSSPEGLGTAGSAPATSIDGAATVDAAGGPGAAIDARAWRDRFLGGARDR